MEVDKNIYPAVGFNFRVTSSDANFGLIPASVLTGFELNKSDASFQSVTGISAKLATKVYGELGSNNRQIVLPESVSYGDLELKRGIVNKDSDIGKWCNSFLTNDQWTYFITRKTVNVFLLDLPVVLIGYVLQEVEDQTLIQVRKQTTGICKSG